MTPTTPPPIPRPAIPRCRCPQPRMTPATAPKSPVVALVLAACSPGIGQIYNGQPAKAMVFFFAWAGSIYLTAETSPFFAFLIAFTYLYNLVDAWRSASAINARHARPAAESSRVRTTTEFSVLGAGPLVALVPCSCSPTTWAGCGWRRCSGTGRWR